MSLRFRAAWFRESIGRCSTTRALSRACDNDHKATHQQYPAADQGRYMAYIDHQGHKGNDGEDCSREPGVADEHAEEFS